MCRLNNTPSLYTFSLVCFDVRLQFATENRGDVWELMCSITVRKYAYSYFLWKPMLSSCTDWIIKLNLMRFVLPSCLIRNSCCGFLAWKVAFSLRCNSRMFVLMSQFSRILCIPWSRILCLFRTYRHHVVASFRNFKQVLWSRDCCLSLWQHIKLCSVWQRRECVGTNCYSKW
jgi:hypothetical protein